MPGHLTHGVYLHIPFCAARCDYCAFATWTDRHHLIDRYLAACRTDITRAVDDGALPPATSVFVGGGTPSLVDADGLARVLDAIPLSPDAEVTVECNPDSVDETKLRTYVAAGVNRVSFGVQSMVPRVLTALGRTHDPDNVFAAVDAARAAGVASLNLDLIYGAAGETVDDWSHTVDAAIALEPEHISAYALTVEPGTALADDPGRHPDDDDQADKYALATDRLGAAGFDWYEISNWARPGHECRHNLLYWTQGNYHGFGCAAHAHRDGHRWWNVRTPDRYIDAIESGASPVAGEETLDESSRQLEGLQLSLRTCAGVPDDALDVDDAIADLVNVDAGRVTLTLRGRFLANEIALRLRPI